MSAADVRPVAVTSRGWDLVRAAGSLVLHVAFALALIVALHLTVDATAYGRGVALLAVLVFAVLFWAAPSLMPRRHR